MNISKLNICQEEPVELYLNGNKIVTFMCTLENLRELALGHMFSRGMINSPFDLDTMAACKDMRKIYATTSKEIDFDSLVLETVLTSSCGSGSKFNEESMSTARIASRFDVSLGKVRELMAEMFARAEMYKTIGGMHCMAIADNREILTQCEDVGRHNAADKAIGKALMQGVDMSNAMLLSTGRISSDLVLKAANVKCPVIASRSIITSSGLELAEKLGITIIGRAVSNNPIVYLNEQRIAS
ncbi:formate dehydrogenase accessory sulfurtransferase FdhD [Alkalibacter rhizosphaerae]|uniref:Formate dehydrogenase accessory sulfurtransferase FdhD n=1 Tax=Alkalibacter rhizosphaerae TaxID=2815577 RepID=A0A975AIX7_9FIRM|nr:formate dehydrogenase accessory sulfurtransferase FdhD [Alkalibacter rhizosphaerae]QSX09129.1 formate dehydrogenase accessory sulfurtransferase FdhD [Alkalibacter rhizosphaerae]